MKPASDVICEALRIHPGQAAAAILALQEAGWHLVSDAAVRVEDDPRSDPRVSPNRSRVQEPQHRVIIEGTLDGWPVSATRSLSGWVYDEHEGEPWVDALLQLDTSRDYLRLIGERLGLPDPPRRLAKSGDT